MLLLFLFYDGRCLYYFTAASQSIAEESSEPVPPLPQRAKRAVCDVLHISLSSYYIFPSLPCTECVQWMDDQQCNRIINS